MKINPILPILDTHPAKEITKKTEQTRKNAENNNYSTNRKELYDVITNVIGDSGFMSSITRIGLQMVDIPLHLSITLKAVLKP